MKNLIAIVLIALVTTTGFANNERFIKEMSKSIEILYAAGSVEEHLAIIQKFERIAQAEPNQWEPRYYAAYGYLNVSHRFEEAAKKDQYLDLALEAIKEGIAIAPDESELYVLQGYIHMMQLVVDPMTRGAQYSGMAFAAYNKGLELNNENPRAWYMLGNMQLGTAKFMGTGNEEGCKSLSTALEKYDNYTSDNPIAPKWGKKGLMKAMETCNEE
ncbi:MAG: hypothetical protein NXI20_22915 [bacterium]|nr:hypothetical protein [bacterium]